MKNGVYCIFNERLARYGVIRRWSILVLPLKYVGGASSLGWILSHASISYALFRSLRGKDLDDSMVSLKSPMIRISCPFAFVASTFARRSCSKRSLGVWLVIDSNAFRLFVLRASCS